MEKELYRKYKLKLFITALCIIIIAALISGSILYVKATNINEKIQKIEQEKNNKYSFKNVDALTFLSEKQIGKYKKEIIGACEAYNLQNVSEITIDDKSISFDKTTNIYEWKVSCNDKRNVKFVSAFKKTTNLFSSELDRIDEQKTADKEVESPNESVCNINNIIFPKDFKFLKTEEQQQNLKEDLAEYLSVEEIVEVESIQFEKYEDKEKTRLYFKAEKSKPIYIEGIVIKYDKKGNYSYEIKKEVQDE